MTHMFTSYAARFVYRIAFMTSGSAVKAPASLELKALPGMNSDRCVLPIHNLNYEGWACESGKNTTKPEQLMKEYIHINTTQNTHEKNNNHKKNRNTFKK